MTLQCAISGRTRRTAEDRIYRPIQSKAVLHGYMELGDFLGVRERAERNVGAEVVVHNPKDQ